MSAVSMFHLALGTLNGTGNGVNCRRTGGLTDIVGGVFTALNVQVVAP